MLKRSGLNAMQTSHSPILLIRKFFFENIIKPALLGQNSNKEVGEHAILHELPEMLDYMNESISKNLWIAGDYFSMADIAIVVQLLALKTVGSELAEDRWLKFKNYLKRGVSRPSFHEASNTKLTSKLPGLLLS